MHHRSGLVENDRIADLQLGDIARRWQDIDVYWTVFASGRAGLPRRGASPTFAWTTILRSEAVCLGFEHTHTHYNFTYDVVALVLSNTLSFAGLYTTHLLEHFRQALSE